MTKERFSNRIARVVLGAVFAVVAFVVERRVIKAIKKGQLGPKAPERSAGLAATTTGEGVEVTPDPRTSP
jgi:hypothetical protein